MKKNKSSQNNNSTYSLTTRIIAIVFAFLMVVSLAVALFY